jgi:hypothetical protein
MNLTPLRTLLKQEYSHEVCVEILSETSRLYREDLPNRWYFLLLNRLFAAVDSLLIPLANQLTEVYCATP